MRRRTACLAAILWVIAFGPRLARADNTQDFVKEALGAYSGKLKFPIDFYLEIPPEYTKVRWDPSVPSGMYTITSTMVARWDQYIRLNPGISADGHGGGGITSVKKITPSNAGSMFHESLHAYMDWARGEAKKGSSGNARARRMADFQKSVQCRYRSVVLQGSTQPATLDDAKQWEMVEESWTTWISSLTSDWTQSAQWVSSGALTEQQFEERIITNLTQTAKNGPPSGPYYTEGGKNIYATNKRMSAREMKFLMENLLGLDKSLVDRIFVDFKNANSWDSDAANLCLDRSIVYVLDASGSMADNGKIGQAKSAIEDSLKGYETMPAGSTEWALLVYGPGGCGGAQVASPFTTDSSLIREALAGVGANGPTPLAKSTSDAAAYIRSDARGRKSRALLVLTDGGESCQGNPIEAAKSVRKIPQSLPVTGGTQP